jgi:PIN domain nuclease of toxin-antitoxin system
LSGAAVVLDSSALLALAHGEPGAGRVAPLVELSVISAVNWAEVVESRIRRGRAAQSVRAAATQAGIEIVPLDARQAEIAAELREPTRRHGLSLADRCCLALALGLRAPALTTDRAWAKLDVGVEIELIR